MLGAKSVIYRTKSLCQSFLLQGYRSIVHIECCYSYFRAWNGEKYLFHAFQRSAELGSVLWHFYISFSLYLCVLIDIC